jgi:PAS domain S-box-containing protein
VVRWATSAGAALAAATVQYALLPQPAIAPFVFFYFTVALASWLAGRGPGLLAVVLSAAVANYLFVDPHHQWSLSGPALTATILFMVSGGAVSLLCASFRKTALEAHDATAVLHAKAEELWRTTEELHSLAEGLPQLVFATDHSGKPEYYSRRWREYTGEEPGADGTYRRFIHPEDAGRVLAAWEEAVRARTSFQIEYRIRGRDGRHRWFLGRGWPMRDAEGNVLRWFGTATDVDEMKEAHAERERLLGELRAADRRKDEFLAILSHELRNPLAPIRNGIYVLDHAPPGSESARRAHAVIDRQVQHLTRLVDDLLDVTRISRGKIRIQRERLDLAAIVRRTTEDHREQFSRSGIQLDVLTGEEPVHVSGDATRLAQIVGNLLQNAAKFTPRGGRTTVTLDDGDGWNATVAVRDTGVGIAPEVLAHLFEPFVQGETTLERSAGGLGLGLALVKALVELHEGTVSAESEGTGKGATFLVRLPLEARGGASG